MNQFYNPKMYKPAPKRELSAEDRIAVNMGGTPPPPPETFGPYTKKGQESNGVLTMMDMLIADLDKEMQEMGVEEKDAQADYEAYIEDSAAKRAADSKSIEEKESAKAAAEEALGKA